jgi:hypothetical protein
MTAAEDSRRITIWIGFDEVRRICEARACEAKLLDGVLGCEIRFYEHFSVICVPGGGEKRWNPLEVFADCHRAAMAGGKEWRPGKTTPPVGLDTKSHGLKEDLIAAALSADGVWPYTKTNRTIALEALLRCEEGSTRGLMFADAHPKVREAARAVVDAGLAELVMGPKGGWSKARVIWLPLAKLDTETEPETKTETLTPEEDDSIGGFAR